MTLSPLAAYLFSILTTLSPIERAVKVTYLPQAKETVEQRTERYEQISATLAEVLETEERLPFGGDRRLAHSGALALSLWYMESGFRRDVDLGLGKEARGGGMDSCLAQIRLGKNETTPEGWTWQEVVSDRKKCFTSAIRMIRRSMTACRGQALEHRLSAYAAGVCDSKSGHQKSLARWSVYRHVVEKLGAPKNADFIAPISAPSGGESPVLAPAPSSPAEAVSDPTLPRATPAG